MKQIYSTLMMLAMMVAALSFTACGGDDDEDEDESKNSRDYLTLIKSNGEKYYSLTGIDWMNEEDYAVYGYLTKRGHIFCFMCKENTSNTSYLHIMLPKDMSISDFPTGYDLGECPLRFGIIYTIENEYDYDSGSLRVVKNDGKSFTLEFKNYKAVKDKERSITVNGRLYVVNEELY